MILADSFGEALGEAIGAALSELMIIATLIAVAGGLLLLGIITIIVLAIVKHYRKKKGVKHVKTKNKVRSR